MTTYKLCSLIKKELSWKSITKIYLGKLPSDWKLIRHFQETYWIKEEITMEMIKHFALNSNEKGNM